MEAYITDSLAADLICLSSSPVGAGFFFVDKKDKTFCSCIDYRGLDDITVKNKYQLPLLEPTLSSLHEASVFTKLDLCNAYIWLESRRGMSGRPPLTNAPAVFQALILMTF